MSRRLAFVVLSLLAFGGVAAAFFAWAPGAVRDKALSTLRARTGLAGDVGEVDLGLRDITLREITLHDDDDSLSLRIGVVTLHTRTWAWLDGSSGISRVAAQDVTFRASVDGWKKQAARLQRNSAQGPSGASQERVYTIDNLRVDLHDAAGPLVAAEEGSARLENARWVMRWPTLCLGHEGADQARLYGLRVEAERVQGPTAGPISVALDKSEWTWIAPEQRSTRTSIRDRLSAWIRPSAHAAPLASSTSTPWFKRLTFRAENTRVHMRSAAGVREIGRDISVALIPSNTGDVRTRGKGVATDGGAFEWDLTVAPATWRVEGRVVFEALPLSLLLPLLPSVPWHAPDRTRLRGALRVRTSGAPNESVIAWDGELAVTDLGIQASRISATPITGVDFRIEGHASVEPGARRLTLEEARVSLDRASFSLRGTWEWAPDHYLFDARAELPETSCHDALAAIPRDLLADTAGFDAEGTIAASASVRVDSRALPDSTVEVSVSDLCRFTTIPALADLTRFDAPFLHTVAEPDGTTFEMTTGPGSEAWTPIDAISPFLLHAILAHEDAGFFKHHGFAPSEIQVALVRNLEAGRYVQGASTITMQLVKNVFLHREKTLARKLQEVLLTWWIERSWSKRAILELYANVIEYGPAVYGIRAASEHYFGTTPAQLSPAQAAFLATILPNPKAFDEMARRGAISASVARRMTSLLTRMEARGRIDAEALRVGLAETAVFRFGPERDPAFGMALGTAAPLPLEDLLEVRRVHVLDAAEEWPADDPIER